MATKSILIPQGLNKLHPQLELTLKSIKSMIEAMQSSSGGARLEQIQNLQESLSNLQRQITDIQNQINALPGAGDEEIHPFLLMGA